MTTARNARERNASAERSRAYRERRAALGERDTRTRRGRGNLRPTLWETGEFVAIDGEGFSEGDEWSVVTKSSGSTYKGRDHYYAYLSASDGSAIYSAHGRLDTGECLRFLCAIKTNTPHAIIVAFGASYDINHIFFHALNRDQILRLIGKHKTDRYLDLDIDGYQYRLEYRPRKCLTIKRWGAGERKYCDDGKGGWKLSPHLSVQIWDVWGFFQDSFAGVMKKWLPDDPDYDFIVRMKGERSVFDRSEIEMIKTYNAAELRCLVKIMERVRAAINDLGLKITRWDGAGALAAAFMAKHGVKKMLGETPKEIFDAARVAYSGGHIEVCKVGYHSGKVHHYDVNSAYPHIFRRLPALSTGRWRTGHGPPPSGFTLVEIRFEFEHDRHFYPLFFRSANGSIIYPRKGRGYYWHSEYQAAKNYADRLGAKVFEVVQWHHFECDETLRPFAWVEDAYAQRQAYIETAKREGRESGPEKIIKLGCNALYGKTAQQVGARVTVDGQLKLPPYFDLCWAGYVTAGCRAMLMEAAIQDPSAIIGFATDGLFSIRPLDLYCPERKELGAWEYKVHDGITMVMPGVYWLHDGEEIKHFSRGFDKREMKDVEIIHQAWRRKQQSIAISITRLIGMGTAAISSEFWRMRGCFVTARRTLALDGDNSKRYPITLSNCRPERGLVDTMPRDHLLGDNLGIDDLVSAPYPISWLDGDIERDALEGEMVEEREIHDAELA